MAAEEPLGAITHVQTAARVAALTFDDGPHPEYTPALLDLLGKYNTRATFFMVGEAAARHPELVARVAASHAIGNHSWDHPKFNTISGGERRQQITRCADALTPHGLKLFRPPHGVQTIGSRWDARQLGYQTIGWSVDAEDWLPRDPEWMAVRLLERAKPGSIILLHDAIFKSDQPVPQYNRDNVMRAVNLFLSRLAGQLQLVTVPELLQHGPSASDESSM